MQKLIGTSNALATCFAVCGRREHMMTNAQFCPLIDLFHNGNQI